MLELTQLFQHQISGNCKINEILASLYFLWLITWTNTGIGKNYIAMLTLIGHKCLNN